jgi:membrane protein implicated in regulation of membrane protease activity
MVARNPGQMWGAWRKAGLTGPLGALIAMVALYGLAGFLLFPGWAGVLIALSVSMVVAASLAVLLPWRLQRVRRRQLTRSGTHHLFWAVDASGEQWAIVTVVARTDGTWRATDFLSTSGGVGRPLVRLVAAAADDLGVPVALKCRGPRMVAYYQQHGFRLVGATHRVRLTCMMYAPAATGARLSRSEAHMGHRWTGPIGVGVRG